MVHKRCAITFIAIISLAAPSLASDTSDAESGPYIDRDPPGLKAVLHGPDLLSTEANELNCAYSPDGCSVVFTERIGGRNTLLVMHRTPTSWSDRQPLPFSGRSPDVDPFFAPDGSGLFFSSTRLTGPDDRRGDANIWFVPFSAGGGWGVPAPVSEINSPDRDEYYTSVDSSGNLYFSIFPDHGAPGDIYRSTPSPGGLSRPVRLEAPIGTEHNEHDPLISPDGRFLVFTSDRPGGHGRGDLWVVFRAEDDCWSEAVNLGPEINTDSYEFCPMLSPDGRYLFFTRSSGGQSDIYWIDAAIIPRARE